MTSLEEKIPALPLWKIFYDTIQFIKSEYSETQSIHLRNIVYSEELTRILVYNRDPALTFEQYEDISQRYKAFTMWLLGRFFYLLSSEKLSRMHDLVVESQLRILHLISITQPHIYHELSDEYSDILKRLNEYDANETMRLMVFKPQQFDDLRQLLELSSVTIEISSGEECDRLKAKILTFVGRALVDNLRFHNLNRRVYDNVDDLILILRRDNLRLKFAALDVYKKILQIGIVDVDQFPYELKEKFCHVSGILERLAYKILDVKSDFNEEIAAELEEILIVAFKRENEFNRESKTRIAKFVVENTTIKAANLKDACGDFLIKHLEGKSEFFAKMSVRDKNKLRYLTKTLSDDLRRKVENRDHDEFNEHVKRVFGDVDAAVKDKLNESHCSNGCVLKDTLEYVGALVDAFVKIKVTIVRLLAQKNLSGCDQMYLDENEFLLSLISFVNNHVENCKERYPYETFVKACASIPIFCSTINVEIIFHIVAYQFMPLFYKSSGELPIRLRGYGDVQEAKTKLRALYNNLALREEDKKASLKNVFAFMSLLSSGLVNTIDSKTRKNLDRLFLKIVSDVGDKELRNDRGLFASYLTHIVSCTANEATIPKLSHFLTNHENLVFATRTKMLPQLICTLHSSYAKIVTWNDDVGLNLASRHVCVSCNFPEGADVKSIRETLLDSREDECSVVDVYESSTCDLPFDFVWKLYRDEGNEYKDNLVGLLPSVSSHYVEFHSPEIANRWMQYAGNGDKIVRREFVEVVLPVLQFMQRNTSVSPGTKDEILRVCLRELFLLTKKSLQHSDFQLQETLLETIDRLTCLKMKVMYLQTMKMLLYFLMIPTSKYSAIAFNVFSELANRHNTKASLLYGKYRKELCQCIVELCVINQELIGYGLASSLEKVSLVFGYFGTKEFVHKQSNYLLPFFVGLIVTMPKVLSLIEEIAYIMEEELGDLLATNYGDIFLHIFLNESRPVFHSCMTYLEETTKLSGPVLRKRNFKTILNKLLLNFHEKQDKVLLALELLAKEDTESQSRNVPDYLLPRFLGVLQYFDTKLFVKEEALLSLTQIFKFMGPKRIAPFQFKIIAMLRTALSLNYGEYPELNCNVWDAFVRGCDVEALGPQLATIFVSILPLSRRNESKINDVFRYLVVENENLLKDHIPDLFFALDFEISNEVHVVIERHMERFERLGFGDRLRSFLKYLTHETNDVRVYGLKFLKKLMEKNREELDRMVLGYNGIDCIVVELLEILTQGCRENDQVLRMACGECIGELGAIEPSHLPRRYTQAQSFTFFITEDAFILNSLSEFIRALQAEKSTTVMDKFSLAIQGTLKIYGISPDAASPKHNLWKSFSQSHQELMLPLLSSRYTVSQALMPTNVSPVYGSAIGTNFQLWVYNWMCNLILTIKTDKRAFLEVCVPSLKQDHRTLMSFLPHILLHSLLEGTRGDLVRTEAEFNAVLNSFGGKKAVDDEFFYTRPLRTPNYAAKPRPISSEDMKRNKCTKVVFVLLDFLDRWVREFQWKRGAAGTDDDNYRRIQDFSSRFCKLQLAQCSFQCQEYPRTLMYLEDYVAKNPGELGNHLSFLAEVYAQLDEPDAVAGVTALQHSEPTLEQRIRALEVTGKLSDVAACYERIPPPLKLQHLKGLIQCYLDLDNVNTALNLAEGALEKQPEYGEVLLRMQAEPLWRLGKYDELDNLSKRRELVDDDSWGLRIGQVLLHLQNGKRDDFQSVLAALRLQQINSMSSTSLEEGVYQHGYSFIAKLHVLNELEQVERVVYDLLLKANDRMACEAAVKRLTSEWQLRIKVVQESVRIIEPMLCLRRAVLEQAKRIVRDKVRHSVSLFDSLLGESWLLSAKIARHSGVHQQAYTYILRAEEYAPPRLFLEKAKLHWMREEHEQALITLKRGVENILPDNYASLNISPANLLSAEQKEICAEAKLLIATYNDNISNVETEVNILHYKEAIDMNKEWEKSFTAMAQYFDRVFQTYSDEDRDTVGSDMQIRMINCFGKSLQYGTSYVYQSMPRMLSIWFDYGSRLLEVTNAAVRDERKNNLLKMTKLIDSFVERLPSYVFLTAFSQIVSRICHPQKEVYKELKSIITKMILQYPQQTMWMMISVIKSSYTVRSKRCAEILGDSLLKSRSMTKLVGDFTKLAEKLIELCNKEIGENVTTASVNALLRTLPRLLTKEDFSEIMIPTQKFRKLVLPNPDFKTNQHNPFPNHYVHIAGIEDEVVVLASLQRPRKITFKGSDGKKYIQMLKPKDDLRKDFRLMEFNDIVNQLLSRESDSRQRRLNIRLYSVVPLNEECGLIEWVPNLVGLRPILMYLYKQTGQGLRAKELKESCPSNKDPLSKKREIFEKKMLPKHPPILGDWFRKTFPNAQGWLMARTAYIRTTAVISMVGYILGLGDRHGENILLDSTCGDTVHVDFNCLFNKGETFEWPERVPFRLTHNMVSAMGPLGVEGVFRKSCACTLRVLRTHTNTLMSIVTPFVYDPLVSWPRNVTTVANTLNPERTNEQAVEHVRNIELRLQGIVKTRGRSSSIPLSVEGQTNNIILDAMSVNNLCQMYVGWGAYL